MLEMAVIRGERRMEGNGREWNKRGEMREWRDGRE